MKLAIVHYHLDRGGVTQVITEHVQGLAELGLVDEVLVCTGRPQDAWAAELSLRGPLTVHRATVPGLDYDHVEGRPEPYRLAGELLRALRDVGFGADDTVVHVHNHSLGKNVSIPGAVRVLAEQGFRLLLQVHDFAEDLRPQNYRRLRLALAAASEWRLGEELYPQAPQIHYAVLNRRDAGVLAAAGVSSERLHVLANPVPERVSTMDPAAVRATLADRHGIPTDKDYLLYPARAIRRKNLGEALLWTALFPERVHLGVTLAPTNEREWPRYARWRQLAADAWLPVSFETGGDKGIPLEHHLRGADAAITTSVSEGFGLVFLEAFAAGRALVGRNLPEVTHDALDAGVTFPGLAARLEVPVQWIGRRHLLEMLERRYNSTVDCYGRAPLPAGEWERALDRKAPDGWIDMADLDAPTQEALVRCVASDPRRRHRLLDANPWMPAALDTANERDHVEANATLIATAYSRSAAAERLAAVYGALLSTEPTRLLEAPADGGTILDGFLSVDRFRAVLA